MELVKHILRAKLFTIILILLCSLPLIFPLFHPGFFVSDDGDILIIRLTAFHEAFAQGQFPVRLIPRLYFHYGYPVSNFLYPGYLYISEAFHLIHFGFINSIKILLILSLSLSGVFTYLWLNKWLKKFPSIIGSLVYLYAPYHYYDMYKRGSIGEVLALAVVPFVFWVMELRYVSLIIIGLSFLIISHNTLAIVFLPLLVSYYFIRHKVWQRKNEILRMSLFLIISLLISSFFWIPALYELHYTIFSQTTVSEIGNYFIQPDHMLFGKLSYFYLVVTAGISFVLFKYRQKVEKINMALLTFLGFFSTIALFLNTSQSVIIWNTLPISFIQFPFRLFAITMIFFAMVVAIVIDMIKGKKQYVVGVVLAILFIGPLFFFIRPQEYSGRDDMFYSTNDDSTTIKNEYLPTWVKERSFSKPKSEIEGKGVTYLGEKKGTYMIDVTGDSSRNMRFNMIYYPGWVAKADGVMIPISYNNNKGVMDVVIPRNTNQVTFMFTETPVRMISNILSIIGLIFLGIVLVRDITIYYAASKK